MPRVRHRKRTAGSTGDQRPATSDAKKMGNETRQRDRYREASLRRLDNGDHVRVSARARTHSPVIVVHCGQHPVHGDESGSKGAGRI